MGTLVDIGELMTVRNAADVLGFTVSWVTKLIGRGRIQPTVIDGVTFISRSEVERYKRETQTPVAA